MIVLDMELIFHAELKGKSSQWIIIVYVNINALNGAPCNPTDITFSSLH